MTLAYFNNCALMSTTTFRIGFYNSSRVHGILMSVVLVHNKRYSQPVKLNISYLPIKSVSDTYALSVLQLFLEESLAERRTRNIVSLFEFLYGSLEVEESS